ncbi:MAG: 2-hydroxy-3-oxopropionate reductase [Eubacteriales bacterium]|jgi:2-hydroxy-3-oxopropionate reductase
MKAGFIGLGIMGGPMSRNLLRAGCELLVNDVEPKALQRAVEAGGQAATRQEVAGCEVVFTILPNGDIVREVLLGPEGIAQHMKPGSLVCDMSSVTPVQSREFADGLARYGVRFVDAPVSGGEPKAIDGTLAFMVGGSQEDFRQLEPYFSIMGASSVLVGGTGSGSVAKLANQIIVNLTITAVSEAMVLAEKAGTDPEKVYQAIRGGLAGSTVLDAKAPMMFRRDFKPGGPLRINLKDMKNVMATAHDLDVPLPFSSQLVEVMQALKAGGHLGDDHSGIVQYFEALAGVQVHRHTEEEA